MRRTFHYPDGSVAMAARTLGSRIGLDEKVLTDLQMVLSSHERYELPDESAAVVAVELARIAAFAPQVE
jgi:hypothetical protein